jgi:hypothetical protein
LTIQITNVNGVKIDNVNVAKTAKGKIFEEFTSNAARADEEDFGLEDLS